MLFTDEQLKTLVSGGQSVAEVLAGVSAELIDEALNWYIMLGVLAILKYAAVFVIYAILRGYLKYIAEEFPKVKELGSRVLLASSIVYFVVMSYPSIVSVTKALVAPKIFLIEKANEIRQSLK